jgi:signal transduction histidine kinase
VLEEEVLRMERTLQAFLDFARPPSPDRRTFDLREAVAQTLTLLAARAELKGVALRSRAPSGRTLVEADPGQIRQVLLNLVMNALDASPEGGTVEVAVEADARGPEPDASPGWLVVRVTDEGAGLPRDLGERIFEPFVSTRETGLGLGLPISRRIVAEHGGTISAADRPVGGAEFTVHLMVSGAARNGAPPEAADPPWVAGTTAVANGPETRHALPADRGR